MILVLSELTLREVEAAPEAIRKLVARVPLAHIESLGLSPEAEELAETYIQEGAIGGGETHRARKAANDSRAYSTATASPRRTVPTRATAA